ncbi:CinA family protein [Leucobacter manosquensis]|uniref:CinA family protein n=1 Tax=Leucobacter manosquensis TaxID=2810611 RepID=A0ABS5M3Z4_9MICO|nr:CinA family protein [Leucobacter manosquensis]MBS3181691.1 CinA family protein [Leucobacter manosquensis]
MVESAIQGRVDDLVERIAERASDADRSVAVAESLTGGQLSAALAAAPDSGTWFHGGITAYHPEVKYSLLGAPRGPVVTEPTAVAMAESAARLLLADVVVAVTGVGGPEPDEGKPAGTVVLAITGGDSPTGVEHLSFSGDPIEVMQKTVEAALEAVLGRLAPTD